MLRTSQSLLATALLACASPSAAVTLVDANGFESPDYAPGALGGQQGWTLFGGAPSSATVQSTVVSSGNQALEVFRGSNSDGRWAVPLADYTPERYISIEWDMYVEQTVSTAFGPFFGVEAYDASGALLRIASFGVDATTGEVLFTLRDDGVLPGFLVASGSLATFDAWNQFRVVLDYETDTMHGFLNDTLAISTPFEQDGANSFSDADITAMTGGGDGASRALTGTAFFDNFLVEEIIEGDFNGDDIVDAADYTVWRELEGSTGGGLAADADFDGDVDANDLDAWIANYGAGAPTAVAIPEPASALLLALGLSTLRARR